MLGRRGEDIAARFLEQHGYSILDRNWRCRQGEIDLVARDGSELVFVEVRTRRGTAMGSPEESITPRKQARLVAVASAYIQQHDFQEGSWRIDVVAVAVDRSGAVVRLSLVRDAVVAPWQLETRPWGTPD
jgi:putative endonuclease